MEPAVAPGERRRLRVLVITAVHRPWPVGSDEHLADRADRHLAVVGVDQPDVDPRPDLAAGAGLGRIGLRDDRRRDLGHVEDRVDVDPEALVERPRGVGQRDHEGGADAVVAVARRRRRLHQEGRHDAEQEHRGAVGAAHEIPEAVGRIALHQRDRAAAGQHDEGDAHPADMEDRHVDEEPVVAGDEIPRLGPGIGEQVEVRRQHALRRPGGARGVDDRLVVPRLDRANERGEVGLAPVQRGIVDRPEAGRCGTAPDDHDGRDPRRVGHLQSVEQPAMGDEHRRVRIAQDMFEQIAAISGVERDEHCAEIIDRVEDQQRVAAVGQPHRDVIALLHPQTLEPDRDADDPFAQLGVGPVAVVLEHDIELVGTLAGPAVEQVTQDAVGSGRDAGIGMAGRSSARLIHAPPIRRLFYLSPTNLLKRRMRRKRFRPVSRRFCRGARRCA